jgi:hypothetical protein
VRLFLGGITTSGPRFQLKRCHWTALSIGRQPSTVSARPMPDSDRVKRLRGGVEWSEEMQRTCVRSCAMAIQ